MTELASSVKSFTASEDFDVAFQRLDWLTDEFMKSHPMASIVSVSDQVLDRRDRLCSRLDVIRTVLYTTHPAHM